jgi:spore coat protein U-like protein
MRGVMKRLLALALMFFAASAAPAHALLCTAIIGCTCDVVASDIVFDNLNPLAGQQPASGMISVDCANAIDVAPAVIVRIDDGTWGTMAARKMRNAAGEMLDYNIYTTNQYNVIWGDLTGGASNITISGGLLSIGHWTASREMFGRVNPVTTTKPGNYSDTVVVQIIW